MSIFSALFLLSATANGNVCIGDGEKFPKPAKDMFGQFVPQDGYALVFSRQGRVTGVSTDKNWVINPETEVYQIIHRETIDITTANCTTKNKIPLEYGKVMFGNSIDPLKIMSTIVRFGRDYDDMIKAMVQPFLGTICVEYDNTDIEESQTPVMQAKLLAMLQEYVDANKMGVTISWVILSDLRLPPAQQVQRELESKERMQQRLKHAEIETQKLEAALEAAKVNSKIALENAQFDAEQMRKNKEAKAKLERDDAEFFAILQREKIKKSQDLEQKKLEMIEIDVVRANNTKLANYDIDLKWASNTKVFFGKDLPSQYNDLSNPAAPAA